MKYKNFILLAVMIALCIQNSCEKNTPDSLSVRSILYTGCNKLKSDHATSKSDDCIKYQFIDNKYLKISRSNVSFNCATDSLGIDLNQKNNSIVITETGRFSRAANCNCLNDFEYTIGPLDQKSYAISIHEDHGGSMTFYIDLTKNTEGEYCETRTGYPWY